MLSCYDLSEKNEKRKKGNTKTYVHINMTAMPESGRKSTHATDVCRQYGTVPVPVPYEIVPLLMTYGIVPVLMTYGIVPVPVPYGIVPGLMNIRNIQC